MTRLISATTLSTKARAPASVSANALIGKIAKAAAPRPVPIRLRRVMMSLVIRILKICAQAWPAQSIWAGVIGVQIGIAAAAAKLVAAVLQIDRAACRIAVGAVIEHRIDGTTVTCPRRQGFAAARADHVIALGIAI